jgi:hypothetical protein
MPLSPINVYTNLDPQTLNAVGLHVAKLWISFALGGMKLGGKVIARPTGRYASSISYRRYGAAHVAILSDETFAPEAAILETGHPQIDMKEHLKRGSSIPMHRGLPGHYGSAGYGSPFHAGTPRQRRLGQRYSIWGQIRSAGFSGFASVGSTGWIIPPMPAYSPAKFLADLIVQQYGGRVA